MNTQVIKTFMFQTSERTISTNLEAFNACTTDTVLITLNQAISSYFCVFLLFFLISAHVVIKPPSNLASETRFLCSRRAQKLSISEALLTQAAQIVRFDWKQFVLFIKMHPLGMQERSRWQTNKNYSLRSLNYMRFYLTKAKWFIARQASSGWK